MLRRSRPRRGHPRRRPRADRGADARRGADLRARPGRGHRPQPRPPRVHARRGRRGRRRRLRLRRRGNAADAVGRRRPLRRVDGRGRDPPGRRGRDRDEEHRPRRDGREGARRARRARPHACRLRVEPRVHRGGLCRARLHASRPHRRRRLRAGPRRRRRGAPRGHRRAGAAHGRQLGRNGQAHRQRLPVDADQLHQRDRERLRARRCRRRARREGRRPRPPPRAALPPRRHRLRWLVLPEGRLGAEAARGQLGLPLPAARGRDRGERAAEAASRREARALPRAVAGDDDRVARPRLQAEHGRHARGAVDRDREPPRRRGRPRPRLGPDRRCRARAPACRGARPHAVRGRSRRRCGGDRDGVAGAARDRARGCPRLDAAAVAHRRAEHARPAPRACRRLRLRRDRPRLGLAGAARGRRPGRGVAPSGGASSSPAARPSGSATLPRAARRRSSPSPGTHSPSTRSRSSWRRA